MFGDFVGRGSAGGVFTSPNDPSQVIKIMNLNSPHEMVRHMNRLQLQFFEELESQQKQGAKTPGLPKIRYTFTGEMTPYIMEQMRDAVLDRNQNFPEDEYLSGLDYSDIKSKFRYGDEYAIVLMDRVGQIGSRVFDTVEPLGRRGLTPMLRHAYNMGYYIRDLWPENKGMSATGDIIWFDPMVVPIRATTDEDRRAQQVLLEWNEDTQTRYQNAIRDGTYFDYEHKAGLFYSEDTTTYVTYDDPRDPVWIVKARNLVLDDHFETGILDEDGNRYAQVMLGSDYSDILSHMIKANPNGFLMIGHREPVSDQRSMLRNILGKGDHDNTFWVFPINTSDEGGAFDGVVLDGNYIFSDGRTGTYDTFPLTDLFDATAGTNPKYYLSRFTKRIAAFSPYWETINYHFVPQVDKSLSAESYKPPAAAIKAAKKGLAQRKEWGRGGLSPAEAKSQGIDSGVTRARKIASGKVSRHDVRRMSAFNRHRKNNRPDKKMPDGGPTAGTIAWNLWGGTSGVNWAKKKSASMNAEGEDNYWLRGGCGKAADAIASDLDQQGIPYQFELGAAYLEDAFVGNHIVVIANGSDIDMYGTGGAKKRWEDMMLADYDLQELPRSVSSDTLRFQWQTVDPATDWSIQVEGDYLPVTGPMITKETLGMSAESYPQCYLCSKPSKIEVMTAVGMRSFCGNQCRGHYEGIDYGPDDYYISPPLEHDLEIVDYNPGVSDYDYSSNAKIRIKCRNCDFTSHNLGDESYQSWAEFDRPHVDHKYKIWNPEEEEWEPAICPRHDFQIVRYLTNRWSRGDEIAGDITVKCSKCGFADIVTHQWIPETECPNTGRSENYVSFHQLDL